ncbi:hypothetical protein GOBAR_AA29589 [Gossypium barbadense]|uniref:Uncharacterized protein n=1 Tax=Gossypium barbadense TaxID=3634 RepID=A0A2P5WJ42_GOSBA|nr:hypothetical protein GOBAR_AA29589 [Gossypium barbadense]
MSHSRASLCSLLPRPCVRVPCSSIVVHGLMAQACLTPVSKKPNRALPLARSWFSIPTLVFTYQVHPRSCRTAVGIYRIPCVGEIAELGVNHLHHTEWKNTEYRKRDFLIQCGSDNVRICGIYIEKDDV